MATRQISAFVGVLVCCLPVGLAAQDYSVPVYIGPWDFNTPWIASDSINNMINRNMLEDQSDQASTPDVADDNAASQSASATSAAPNLGFRYSAERSQQNLRTFLAGTSDPAQLEQLAQVARQGAKDRGIDLSLMTLTEKGFVARKGR